MNIQIFYDKKTMDKEALEEIREQKRKEREDKKA
jgi:hypothetical protein